jgi:hypothetical protein
MININHLSTSGLINGSNISSGILGMKNGMSGIFLYLDSLVSSSPLYFISNLILHLLLTQSSPFSMSIEVLYIYLWE